MVVEVNDLHSELNATKVREVVVPESLAAIMAAIEGARDAGIPVAISGGRYAMGGQQFCADGLLLDTRRLNRVLGFDRHRGLIEVEAGIQWPGLIDYLESNQADRTWAIAQKQTGADRLSMGGAISANAHGRGLTMKPFVSDVESLVLVNADGEALRCSRDANRDLFRLVAGGYGLFGCIYSVSLRLVPRRMLERVVELADIVDLMQLFEERIEDGFLYGDFQFVTDSRSDGFLQHGVFSCYRPMERDEPPPPEQKILTKMTG